jgi:hypothetical protein
MSAMVNVTVSWVPSHPTRYRGLPKPHVSREFDSEGIAALYAEGAFWQHHPFRDPEKGYLTRVFAVAHVASSLNGHLSPPIGAGRGVVRDARMSRPS